MASTITPRVGGAVAGAPVNTGAGGIIQCNNVAGTNAITADAAPSIRAYYGNQLFMIRPLQTNTGNVTLNVEGLGFLPWRTPSGAEFAVGALSPNLDYLIKLSADTGEFRTVSPF
jgi:hypothetical protein